MPLLGDLQKMRAKDIILVPIATLGCGKTTLAVALVHLFGWGHVQNDNIQGKGRPPRFTKEVLTQLEQKPVVFADRNNAQRHERQQIIGDVKTTHPEMRLVALNFVHTPDTISKIREVTQTRVLSRGDNHQTIQAASDQNKVLGIMEGFISRFEALNPYSQPDDGFDAVIDLDPTANSRDNLEVIISQLSDLFPKLINDMPSSDDLDEAINVALSEYKPDVRHTIGDRGPKNSNKKQAFVSSLLVETWTFMAIDYFPERSSLRLPRSQGLSNMFPSTFQRPLSSMLSRQLLPPSLRTKADSSANSKRLVAFSLNSTLPLYTELLPRHIQSCGKDTLICMRNLEAIHGAVEARWVSARSCWSE
jgi:tRNA splicing ligase